MKCPECGATFDWRVGIAVTPKMQTHDYFGNMFVVRGLTDDGSVIVESYNTPVGRVNLTEPADDWMTA